MNKRSRLAGALRLSRGGLLVLGALLAHGLATAVVPGLHLGAEANEIAAPAEVTAPATIAVPATVAAHSGHAAGLADEPAALVADHQARATGHHGHGHGPADGPDDEFCLLCAALGQGAHPVSGSAAPVQARPLPLVVRAPHARMLPTAVTFDAPARAPPSV